MPRWATRGHGCQVRIPDFTRWPRRLAVALLLVALLLVALILAVSACACCPASAATGRKVALGSGSPGWTWPIHPATVVRPFSAVDQPYGAGHRGIDLAADPGDPVDAAASGVVTFAGWVAGRPLVVVGHGQGLLTSYEPVNPIVSPGQQVGGGQVIGVVARTPWHCGWFVCLHWGLRDGERYLDPVVMVDRGPPRLLPLSPNSPAPARRVTSVSAAGAASDPRATVVPSAPRRPPRGTVPAIAAVLGMGFATVGAGGWLRRRPRRFR